MSTINIIGPGNVPPGLRRLWRHHIVSMYRFDISGRQIAP